MTASNGADGQPDGTPANIIGRTVISAREAPEEAAEAREAETSGEPQADVEPEERADALDADEPESGSPEEREQRTQDEDHTTLDAPD